MKKIVTMLLILSTLLTASCAFAEGMGVQVIGGPQTEDAFSPDDIKLNFNFAIRDIAGFRATSFEFCNQLGHYFQGNNNPEFYQKDKHYYFSGNEAEYAILRMDVTNLSLSPFDILEACEVKVIYDDIYEFAGWCYQSNYDNGIHDYSDEYWYGDNAKQNTRWAINKADQYAINPMYMGHYIFGCTLPNTVVYGKKPLSMTITLGDGHEFTYNIRK